jgi:hypothetical protein
MVAGPGLKGHRILRRVLGGGRHLGTSRAIGFHESVVTATLAASSRGRRSRTAHPSSSGRRQSEGPAVIIPRKRETRRRCQRHDR